MLSAPAAVQGVLRYFHPSRVGRSRLVSAEKHLCARGTALWTYIRNLVCKGKVGRGVCHGFPGEAMSGQGPCCLDVVLRCSACWLHWERGPGIPFPGGTGKGGSPAKAAFVSPFKENSQWWYEALPLLRSRRDGVCPLPSQTASAQELGVRGWRCTPPLPCLTAPGPVESVGPQHHPLMPPLEEAIPPAGCLGFALLGKLGFPFLSGL